MKPWLDHLLSQDYKGIYDIVIIDGCSSDGTKDILMEYAINHDEIKLRMYMSTQPEALNYAIESGLITGELVALIDGDCVAPKSWLRTLVETLETKNVDAVGGPGLTPDNSNALQRIIGFDLDARFLSIPEGFVKRHPNMNLLIKKYVLDELKFDEALLVGYDTDFGYRLNSKNYTLWYNPSAYVLHFHRASVKGYIKQQCLSGKYAFRHYWRMKGTLRGDNINPITMTIQPIFLGLILLSLVLTAIYPNLIWLPSILSLGLIILFTLDVIRAFRTNGSLSVLLLYPLYLIRLFAWVVGSATGLAEQVIRTKRFT